jgi:hypothetical protein
MGKMKKVEFGERGALVDSCRARNLVPGLTLILSPPRRSARYSYGGKVGEVLFSACPAQLSGRNRVVEDTETAPKIATEADAALTAKENGMNRTILVCGLLAGAAAALGAQQTTDSYQGVSHPPSDDEIVVTSDAPAKPAAGKVQRAATGTTAAQSQPSSVDPSRNFPDPSADDDIVRPAQATRDASQPALSERAYAADPDGDIVHPRTLRPGELGEGTTIRVRLMDRLSTASTEKGQSFRSRVASDVLRDGAVLLPAGAEIDGHVVEVSSGHVGGAGAMRLRPETVILPNGTRYQLHAEVSGTPGSSTHVGNEGEIKPDSRIKRDSVEVGGAVGAGAVTGAIVAGPAGALTGGLIGAGVVTAHLLISHPQATLETGTALLFTLTEPLSMVPAVKSGN